MEPAIGQAKYMYHKRDDLQQPLEYFLKENATMHSSGKCSSSETFNAGNGDLSVDIAEIARFFGLDIASVVPLMTSAKLPPLKRLGNSNVYASEQSISFSIA